MGKAFFTKKQKVQMRERRKKKKQLIKQKNNKNIGDVSSSSSSMAINVVDDTTTTSSTKITNDDESSTPKENNENDNNPNIKKRLREETVEENVQENEKTTSSATTTTTTTATTATTTTTTTTKKQKKKHGLELHTRIMPDGTIQVAQPSNLSSQEAKKFRKDARRQLRSENYNNNNIVIDESTNIEFVSEEEMPKSNSNKNKNKKAFPSIKELLQQKKQMEESRKEEEKRHEKIHNIPEDIKAQYVALDCEMVGIGSDGKKSALARVSIVDWDGNVLLDTFVQVPIRVTDFRTHVSGVEPKHLKRDNNAMDVTKCREQVAAILKNKILVGHALSNDLKALMLTHPKSMIRDTAKYRPFQRYGNNKWRARKLRDLVKENLSYKSIYEGFQEGEHDSVHDAKATMELFQLVRIQWEKELANKK